MGCHGIVYSFASQWSLKCLVFSCFKNSSGRRKLGTSGSFESESCFCDTQRGGYQVRQCGSGCYGMTIYGIKVSKFPWKSVETTWKKGFWCWLILLHAVFCLIHKETVCIYLLYDLTWQATSNPLARRFQPDSTQCSEKPWITVVVVSRLTYRKARFTPGVDGWDPTWRWDEMRGFFLFPVLWFFFRTKNRSTTNLWKNVLMTLEKKWDSCIFQTSWRVSGRLWQNWYFLMWSFDTVFAPKSIPSTLPGCRLASGCSACDLPQASACPMVAWPAGKKWWF